MLSRQFGCSVFLTFASGVLLAGSMTACKSTGGSALQSVKTSSAEKGEIDPDSIEWLTANGIKPTEQGAAMLEESEEDDGAVATAGGQREKFGQFKVKSRNSADELYDAEDKCKEKAAEYGVSESSVVVRGPIPHSDGIDRWVCMGVKSGSGPRPVGMYSGSGNNGPRPVGQPRKNDDDDDGFSGPRPVGQPRRNDDDDDGYSTNPQPLGWPAPKPQPQGLPAPKPQPQPLGRPAPRRQ